MTRFCWMAAMAAALYLGGCEGNADELSGAPNTQMGDGGDGADAATEDVKATDTGIVGTWSATSILIDNVEVLVGTDMSVTLTFARDGSVSGSITGDSIHLFCEDSTACTPKETYALTGDFGLWFCDPECNEMHDYQITEDTLVITGTESDSSLVLTLRRIASGPDGGVVDTGILGTWNATSVLANGVEVFAGTGCSASFTFASDGNLTLTASGDENHLFCTGSTSCSETMVFALTGDSVVWFCDSECNEPHSYEISGSTFVLTMDEEDVGTVYVISAVRAE